MMLIKVNHVLLLAAVVISSACGGAHDKINSMGEKVGEATGEMAQKVSAGMENAMELKVELSDAVKQENISTGKIIMSDSAGGSDNLVSIYFLFGADFKGDLTLKAFDGKELEMGRSTAGITAKKGDAGYADFLFDKRTNIDYNSKLILDVAK